MKTNLQKARHSIKDRCFAEMARRVENGVFRRAQVRKHLRLRRVRIVACGLQGLRVPVDTGLSGMRAVVRPLVVPPVASPT